MFLLNLYKSSLLALLLSSTDGSPVTRDVTKDNVEAAYDTLQQWYNTSIGIWYPSTNWWNSANCLTVISNLASVDTSVKSEITGVIANTYTQAQEWNSQTVKIIGVENDPYLMQTYYVNRWPQLPSSFIQPKMQANSGFLNDYYDDEGWWALAWIAAYDLTHISTYLTQAQTIFADMNAVFGKTNCSTNSGGTGGIWWDKPHTYVNAIPNELFLAVAASLANRVSSSDNPYLSIAKQQWSWFQGSGMIGSGYTINDGLNQQTCENNGGTVWTYNQGVILGALVELSKASGDTSLVDTAHKIAEAAISALAPGGILTEPCELNAGSCGADGGQFKGVFTRNLWILHKASPRDAYKTFLKNNADSIWKNDRNEKKELSLKWAGPFVTPANASTQSSALDTLVAAVAL
ncbi:Six-hairpin glycosidase [Massarina eburnea CBS 473.64]|uniref:Six-hairpin glycosidase n=1 Tax=Massarina eburnea CBS 473.64 TaxID=1395130 RepID=A0A6A6RKP0_9PLEO|nr:Six-hairpin glycosidase [Massarina eburnea CBS 473.64]